ncbi:hypothetical protein M5K25_024580 [Dendrobium thyrsiflorum]|uniref:Uncharacterized protein n=1 Tax=Dendrobium thyrsiflorum TaxID=117978 RepID=A0ABD0U2Q2_DENTH
MKVSVEDRISSMEGKVSDLHEMMKKILDNQNQMAVSEARGPVERNMNSKIRRSENNVEIIERSDGSGMLSDPVTLANQLKPGQKIISDLLKNYEINLNAMTLTSVRLHPAYAATFV